MQLHNTLLGYIYYGENIRKTLSTKRWNLNDFKTCKFTYEKSSKILLTSLIYMCIIVNVVKNNANVPR